MVLACLGKARNRDMSGGSLPLWVSHTLPPSPHLCPGNLQNSLPLAWGPSRLRHFKEKWRDVGESCSGCYSRLILVQKASGVGGQ